RIRTPQFRSLNHEPAVSFNVPCHKPVVAMHPIVLQKSPRRSCGIEIRNNRIGANEFLNRCCAFTLDLESILLARMRKIVLQHNPPESGLVMLSTSSLHLTHRVIRMCAGVCDLAHTPRPPSMLKFPDSMAHLGRSGQ